ncbi:MAG: ABC transporter substrate-binding protein, partial [Deltaproteobacteria bacterium]|nr:ABC transporter substrate-binding protein [Deltaproteobacteria bacterium]
MKKALVLTCLIFALAFAGCKGSDETARTPAAGESGGTETQIAKEVPAPAGDKEVVIAIYRDGSIEELDAATYNGPHILFKMIYDGLVEDGGRGEILPSLATSWDISPDGKTYTYHLREGVKFSDGTDFDADVVIFNLKRWLGNDLFSTLMSYFVVSMEAVDPLTVRITYADEAYPIIIEQTYPRPVRFLSPTAVETTAEYPNGKFVRPIGTGPWMVESYVKEAEFVLVPNPHYWGEKPKIDRLRFKVVPDAQARVLAFRSGEVDILGGDFMGKIPIENIPELTADPDFEVMIKDTLCSHFIAFNNGDGKFSDKNLRLAINHAIDKKAVTENLFDNIGFVADGLYQKEVAYVTPENNYGYPYDPEKAKKLLDDGGYVDTDGDGVREKDGKPL